MSASEWSACIQLRILDDGSRRRLQQRWTRCVTPGKIDDYHIEEKWVDVVVVKEGE